MRRWHPYLLSIIVPVGSDWQPTMQRVVYTSSQLPSCLPDTATAHQSFLPCCRPAAIALAHDSCFSLFLLKTKRFLNLSSLSLSLSLLENNAFFKIYLSSLSVSLSLKNKAVFEFELSLSLLKINRLLNLISLSLSVHFFLWCRGGRDAIQEAYFCNHSVHDD